MPRKGITYQCVYDDPTLGVVVIFELCGCPKQINVDTKIHDLRNLRNALIFDNSTKLVLLHCFPQWR